jgi:hypothetical protein
VLAGSARDPQRSNGTCNAYSALRVPIRGYQFSTRCGADGSARDLGSRGRRFETCHRDQTSVRLGVAVAQWKSRGP